MTRATPGTAPEPAPGSTVGRTLERVRATLAMPRVNRAVRAIGYLVIGAGLLAIYLGDLLSGVWLVLLGWLLTRAARSNHAAGRLSWLLEGMRVRDATDVDLTGVAASLTVQTLLEEDGRQTGGSGVYPVRRGDEVVGIVDVLDADRVPREEMATTRVDQVMQPLDALELLSPDAPLLDTVVRLERSRREALPVADPADPARLLGLVTREKVHQLLRSRAAQLDRERARTRRQAGR